MQEYGIRGLGDLQSASDEQIIELYRQKIEQDRLETDRYIREKTQKSSEAEHGVFEPVREYIPNDSI